MATSPDIDAYLHDRTRPVRISRQHTYPNLGLSECQYLLHGIFACARRVLLPIGETDDMIRWTQRRLSGHAGQQVRSMDVKSGNEKGL